LRRRHQATPSSLVWIEADEEAPKLVALRRFKRSSLVQRWCLPSDGRTDSQGGNGATATAGDGGASPGERAFPGEVPSGVSSSVDDTLVPLLRDDMVSWETLEDRYGSLLELVSILLGVVPNCDRYLEIWEPAFRTYNTMVPNFLNLPFSIFGIAGACREAELSAPAIVELVFWLSVLQMLHRLSCFYAGR